VWLKRTQPNSMLLADRTQEHKELFAEKREAEYFDSTEEFIEKAKFYCRNERARSSIAERGYSRCVSGKYSYVHRLSTALRTLERL
jgi:spore maturation protein CgeB